MCCSVAPSWTAGIGGEGSAAAALVQHFGKLLDKRRGEAREALVAGNSLGWWVYLWLRGITINGACECSAADSSRETQGDVQRC
jgi:hypothetical protein